MIPTDGSQNPSTEDFKLQNNLNVCFLFIISFLNSDFSIILPFISRNLKHIGYTPRDGEKRFTT